MSLSLENIHTHPSFLKVKDEWDMTEIASSNEHFRYFRMSTQHGSLLLHMWENAGGVVVIPYLEENKDDVSYLDRVFFKEDDGTFAAESVGRVSMEEFQAQVFFTAGKNMALSSAIKDMNAAVALCVLDGVDIVFDPMRRVEGADKVSFQRNFKLKGTSVEGRLIDGKFIFDYAIYKMDLENAREFMRFAKFCA